MPTMNVKKLLKDKKVTPYKIEMTATQLRLTAPYNPNFIVWGCGGILGLGYAISPRLSRYSAGLSEPREILMRFSLYQRM